MSESREVIRWRSVARELARALQPMLQGTHYINEADVRRARAAMARFLAAPAAAQAK